SLDGVDVVDLGALEVGGAKWVDDDLDAVHLELVIALGGATVEAEAVLEARTAAALDRDTEHADVLLLREELLAPGRSRLRHAPAQTYATAGAAVRVRRVDGPAAHAALHGQLLPDGDALHRLRHRGRVPVSARSDPAPARLVRLLRVPLLHCDPRRRLRVRV